MAKGGLGVVQGFGGLAVGRIGTSQAEGGDAEGFGGLGALGQGVGSREVGKGLGHGDRDARRFRRGSGWRN